MWGGYTSVRPNPSNCRCGRTDGTIALNKYHANNTIRPVEAKPKGRPGTPRCSRIESLVITARENARTPPNTPCQENIIPIQIHPVGRRCFSLIVQFILGGEPRNSFRRVWARIRYFNEGCTSDGLKHLKIFRHGGIRIFPANGRNMKGVRPYKFMIHLSGSVTFCCDVG